MNTRRGEDASDDTLIQDPLAKSWLSESIISPPPKRNSRISSEPPQ